MKVRKQLWQDQVVAPGVEDLAAALVAADLEEAPEVALAEDPAEADSVADIIVRIMAIITAARASLDLDLAVITTVAADALAAFWAL